MIKTLYYRTNKAFNGFNQNLIRSPGARDDYGPGIYCYGDAHHDAIDLTVEASIKRAVPYDTDTTLHPIIIKQMIIGATDLVSKLNVYGDVDRYGQHKVLDIAIKAYADTPILQVLNRISNDLYRHDCHRLTALFAQLTNIDCIEVPKHNIYVILTSKQLSIKRRNT